MTKLQTLQAIRALGMTARWSSEFQEFRINFRGGMEATAHYTNDADDAIGSAQDMMQHRTFYGSQEWAETQGDNLGESQD